MAARTLRRSDHLVQQFFPRAIVAFAHAVEQSSMGVALYGYAITFGTCPGPASASIRLAEGGEHLVNDRFARSAR